MENTSEATAAESAPGKGANPAKAAQAAVIWKSTLEDDTLPFSKMTDNMYEKDAKTIKKDKYFAENLILDEFGGKFVRKLGGSSGTGSERKKFTEGEYVYSKSLDEYL